ncbi:MAG: SWFGD domain-containing protein, partial [Alphaproteobacteria bacterium]|nr:SWFGD domain-containing protein [Alphaproteobacteria bacterium]
MAGNRDFFERAADEVRSWFGDENADRRRHDDMRADPSHSMHYHSPPPHAGS